MILKEHQVLALGLDTCYTLEAANCVFEATVVMNAFCETGYAVALMNISPSLIKVLFMHIVNLQLIPFV